MEESNPLRRSGRKIIKKDTFTIVPNTGIPNKLRIWSKTEKSQLLAALQVYDESESDFISDIIQTKSRSQVEHYIRNMKSRAETECNRFPEIKELSKWAKFLPDKTVDVSKYDALTIPMLLISAFEDFPDPSSCEGIDFKAAYEFIFCIMAEITPKPINSKTMDFISKTFSEMCEMINTNTDLRAYVEEKLSENIAKVSETTDSVLNPLNFPEINLPISFSHSYDDL